MSQLFRLLHATIDCRNSPPTVPSGITISQNAWRSNIAPFSFKMHSLCAHLYEYFPTLPAQGHNDVGEAME